MDTTLPPQPPADAPAPPPGPEAIRSRKFMNGILWVGGVSILCLLMAPVIFRKRGPHPRTEIINNAKQVGLALFEFDSEYGRFPDSSTIPAVRAATSTTMALGSSSSNDFFRQLIATGLKSEKVFWAETANSPRKGDDVLGAKALEKGECGFTYIAGLTSSGDPYAPVLMAPVIPGTWKFDPMPYKGKAVVLCLDSSARFLPIDKNGDVIVNGMNLFDPRQSYWEGKAPDIKWPE